MKSVPKRVGGRQGPYAQQRQPKAGLVPVLPHLDISFTVLIAANLLFLIYTLTNFIVHGELSQQPSVPMDGPGVDETVNRAAQQGSRVWQAGPGLQKKDLQEKGRPDSAGGSTVPCR